MGFGAWVLGFAIRGLGFGAWGSNFDGERVVGTPELLRRRLVPLLHRSALRIVLKLRVERSVQGADFVPGATIAAKHQAMLGVCCQEEGVVKSRSGFRAQEFLKLSVDPQP